MQIIIHLHNSSFIYLHITKQNMEADKRDHVEKDGGNHLALRQTVLMARATVHPHFTFHFTAVLLCLQTVFCEIETITPKCKNYYFITVGLVSKLRIAFPNNYYCQHPHYIVHSFFFLTILYLCGSYYTK